LRRELIESRIQVIEIAPGQVETEYSVVRFGGDKKKADKVYETSETLAPEDIAEVIVFIASRRENVVVADVLLYPSLQVSDHLFLTLGLVRSLPIYSTTECLYESYLSA
jgi:3-hydroxy acid dehydrogenase/malonic semialdehyde reductase